MFLSLCIGSASFIVAVVLPIEVHRCAGGKNFEPIVLQAYHF